MSLTGQTLGNYQLQGIISRGPRATLYRARQMPVERTVAVKVYDESVDPDDVRRAVELAQTLTHAHVLPADDFGVHRGLAWVAMRHMPVGSIKSRWRRVVPLSDIARILPQIASALDHAHAHDLLHLNLKPTNILLDRPGNAFVSDFGIPTRPDSPYAAPEIARGGTVDARADVYALGALLYEMLTGRAPIARRPRDDTANQRMAELPSPRSIRSSIPPAIEAVVVRALSIDPEARYATSGALAEAFTEAVEVASSEQAASTPPSSRAPVARWIAFGTIGLLLILGVIVAATGSNAPAAAPSPSPTIAASETPLPAASPTSTLSSSPTPTRSRATASPAPRTQTANPTSTLTPSALPTRALTATVPRSPTPTPPAFTVVSLTLKPFPAQPDGGDRLDVHFDAVVQPSVGGPYGQLFAYLPTIDSLVTTRIGAQVSSGTQLLHVTLIVDCARLPKPFATNQIFLEIRPTDRGPTLYATSIDYVKTWCR